MVRTRFIVFSAVTLFLCAFAAAQNRPSNSEAPPPVPEKVEAPRTIPGTAVDPVGIPGIDGKTYVIGAEDVLFIKVWRENDFTGPEAVRPDGKITLPLIGDVQAAGLTPERLAAQLTQALSQYINKPEITVTLAQVNSKKFSITGGVNRPGTYPLVTPIKVSDALNLGGGFRDFANKKDIIIVRGDKRLHFNYNDWTKGKKLDQDIIVENGDTILIKE
ncbi:MAG: polysaccharide biosynthesis/export family protein [Bryobacteraceae bacterium]